MSIGAGVVIARYFGAGDEENMDRAIHTTVAFGLAAGVVMTIVGMALSPQILILMATPENVMVNSVAYLRLYFAGSLGFVLYNIFVGILQAVGDSHHPLYYLIISSVINVVLDITFIRGFHMGVEGAAIATVISQIVSALLCMFQLLRLNTSWRLQLRKIRFHGPMLRQIVRMGLPSGLQNSVIAFANVVVQSNINAFGEMAMAGCGAYAKIEGFGFLPITSFTMALTTFIGQNLGAGQLDRARRGARFGIWVTVILAELIGVLVFVFAPQLIAAFDSNQEVIYFGVQKARTSTLFFFLLAFSHSISAILRGSGKAIVPMIVMLTFWCIVRVGFLSITVPLTHNIQMVYWVYPLTWALSSVTFLLYYKKADWLHGRL